MCDDVFLFKGKKNEKKFCERKKRQFFTPRRKTISFHISFFCNTNTFENRKKKREEEEEEEKSFVS